MSDAMDELVELVLERLTVLEEINDSTFSSGQPTNAMSVKRWIDDVRLKVRRANLKVMTYPAGVGGDEASYRGNDLMSSDECHCGHPYSERRVSAYGSTCAVPCGGRKDYGSGVERCYCVRQFAFGDVPADVQPFPGQPLHPLAAAKLT